jgi:predicted transcriptional regulator
MQRRRKNMSILKAPPKQPRNATLQLRVDEELKGKLEKYGEFLEATTAYVVSEALKLVFNKDTEFKEWLRTQATEDREEAVAVEVSLTADSLTKPVTPTSRAVGNGLFR